jgi:hypothetical protein
MAAASDPDPRRGERDEAEPTDDVEEDEVDEASEESFPASDAPASWSGPPDT